MTPLPPLPPDDPTNKGGRSGRLSYRLSDDVTIEFGFSGFGNRVRFDNPFAMMPSDVFSPYNHSTAASCDGYARNIADRSAACCSNQLTIYGNVTNRDVWETEGCFDASFTTCSIAASWLRRHPLRRRISGRSEARAVRAPDLWRA